MKRAAAAALAAATLLAGCANQQMSLFGGDSAPEATASTLPAKIDMAGRWTLSEPGTRSCGMHFGGGPEIRSGAIQPEGGCPGKFFTARYWMLVQGGRLSINDYQQAPLAELKFADGRFVGTSNAGRPVTLSRQQPPG